MRLHAASAIFPILAQVFTLLLGATAPVPLRAQSAEPCGFERCGLRVDGGTVFQGPGETRVAHVDGLYPDVRFLLVAGDSIAMLARDAAGNAARADLAAWIGAAAATPLYVLTYLSDGTRAPSDDALWTVVSLAAVGVTSAIVAGHWERRIAPALSRAVWAYNRDVAAGAVYDADPDLPPLDPAHFGRAGFAWGFSLGMLGGSVLARGADDAALLELVAIPAASAAVGWAVGRLIER